MTRSVIDVSWRRGPHHERLDGAADSTGITGGQRSTRHHDRGAAAQAIPRLADDRGSRGARSADKVAGRGEHSRVRIRHGDSGLLDLVHVHNPGIAFGFLSDFAHSWQGVLTTGLAVAALAGILYYASHLPSEERIARYGLSLILAGAVGNLIDRSRQGFVVYFVDVYWHDWHFWAFNVADAAISIGAVLILVELLLPKHHASNPV